MLKLYKTVSWVAMFKSLAGERRYFTPFGENRVYERSSEMNMAPQCRYPTLRNLYYQLESKLEREVTYLYTSFQCSVVGTFLMS